MLDTFSHTLCGDSVHGHRLNYPQPLHTHKLALDSNKQVILGSDVSAVMDGCCWQVLATAAGSIHVHFNGQSIQQLTGYKPALDYSVQSTIAWPKPAGGYISVLYCQVMAAALCNDIMSHIIKCCVNYTFIFFLQIFSNFEIVYFPRKFFVLIFKAIQSCS